MQMISAQVVDLVAEVSPTARDNSHWYANYLLGLHLTDVVVIALTLLAAQLIRFGQTSETVTLTGTPVPYVAVSGVIAAIWMVALSATGSRDRPVWSAPT